jgi:MFS family permease
MQHDTTPSTPHNAKRALLIVACLAQFMVLLDVSIVNIALPSIHNHLGFSTTGLQWVVNAYTLTFAGFLLLGGRCADLLGRRRVFLIGTACFALSSLACALANTRGLLIGARAVQGLSGAVLSPATLSVITSSFAEGHERNRALGTWGATGALGASSGALLGGILTEAFGWPAIFAVNVPLGALVIVAARFVIPASVGANEKRHFDVTGAILVTTGLICVTFGIVRTRSAGARLACSRRSPSACCCSSPSCWWRRALRRRRWCRCRSCAPPGSCARRTSSSRCCTPRSSRCGSF